MPKTFRAPSRLLLAAAALAVFAGLAACGDLTRPKPDRENFTDTLTLYAINGTPIDAPSGLWLVGGTGVPLDGSFGFDLAYDIDAQGQGKLYTVRAVGGGLSATHTVGLLKSQSDFDALGEAPTSGFVTDTSFTVSNGDVFAIATADPGCAGSFYSNQIYAKLQVLEINPGNRTVKSRFTVNPNCGYLSLVPSGLPNR